MRTISNTSFYLCLGAIAVVCLTASGLTVMDPDAAQYAEISREMLLSNNPLQVFCLGKPYLDKPPLLFWLTAMSYKIFGVGNIAYRLPSLFFAAITVLSTYRFSKLFYSEHIARMATLMLASTYAFFMLTNDVRTDTLLVGSVMFSVWQLTSYLQNRKMIHLALGAVGVSLAMLAKGPIGFLIPVYALFPYLLFKKEWKKIFDWQYGIAVVIIALLLFPMCLGLYQQYGKEGLLFYFWTQSFGRITGENIWNNNPDPIFLIHTTLWAFLPWSLFLFAGLFLRIKAFVIAKEKSSTSENITTFGFMFTLISMMLSKYQLPHYIFVVYPLGAVIAADAFAKLATKRWTRFLQFSLLVAVWVLLLLVNVYLFPAKIVLLLVLGICLLYTMFLFHSTKDMLLVSLATILSGNLLMNLNFYPQLQRYQPSEEIGTYLYRQHIPREKLQVHFSCFSFALAFYYQNITEGCLNREELETAFDKTKEIYLLVDEAHYNELTAQAKWESEVLKTYYKYGITQLSLPFLNPNTREQTLQKIYLVRLASGKIS